MQEEILNKNIKLSGAEETELQIKLKDEFGKTYSFFKKKKDGNPTKAYSEYRSFKLGDLVEIGYKEVPYKDGTIKNVISLRVPTREYNENQIPSIDLTPAPQDAHGTRLAVHGIINGLVASGKHPSQVTAEDVAAAVALEERINQGLKTQTSDDINVEDIPF